MNDVNFIEINEDDLETIRTWRNSSEVSKYMYTDNLISSDQQESWFKKISLEKNSRYWIIEYQGRKLGLVYIIDIDTYNSKCFWGFYLGDTSIRGEGIGKKVEFNLLNYVFEDLKLNKLCGEVLSFNIRVLEMHSKFGFKKEGLLKQHVKKNGEFVDVITIGLLKDEWRDIKDEIYRKIYQTV
ncbi:UDP-4-amino-4,6-dideoxy-N-acetyl-beta-L-altrosamine N-acetyltransferase [Christiangramia forsetii]|uniref:GNAT family acetyltransferase-possibly polyamine acetyltransferase n=2 Tax=Christiangramia forsetii TaxID=411153 RepID=A0M2Z1_CHRFK|nr:UDP-4-amino-4,6-dideoxy-N-acetyl-beta-L-altrosamine N-acetyltransferase [Christiangramia forsetii]GGG27180.1 UDP-4-amino-4,6-dideoxy-N-acetyl-beta-L-altrosamine N-acetyltransferase [Christiangramia forsetii]CAL66986.1 GNAT family acetyltransferase-possibly polyamine acetyltransferase [Christiangramia forsetii KT0803]